MRTNYNTNANTLNKNLEMVTYMQEICSEEPFMVIKTKYGVGKFHFEKVIIHDNQILLQFHIVDDKQYKDTKSIVSHFGKTCFISSINYLEAYRYEASC